MAKTDQYSPLPPWGRTDLCGAIRAADVGREVALWGWVQTRRDHGGLIFIDLRDRAGIVQLVMNGDSGEEIVDWLDRTDPAITAQFRGATPEQVTPLFASDPILSQATALPQWGKVLGEMLAYSPYKPQ